MKVVLWSITRPNRLGPKRQPLSIARLVALLSAFLLESPAAAGQVTWISIPDLDYQPYPRVDCVGEYSSWQAAINCMMGIGPPSGGRAGPSLGPGFANNRRFSGGAATYRTLPPGGGPRIDFPQLLRPDGTDIPLGPDDRPLPPRPGRANPGDVLADQLGRLGIRRDSTPRIPSRVYRAYEVENVNAYNGLAGGVVNAGGEVAASDLRQLLRTALCRDGASSGFAFEVTTGAVIGISRPQRLADTPCAAVLRFPPETSRDATLRLVRAFITSHSPSLGKSPADHFDSYVPLDMQGSTSLIVAATCLSRTARHVLVVSAPQVRRHGGNPNDFLLRNTALVASFAPPPPLWPNPRMQPRARGDLLRIMDLDGSCASAAELISAFVRDLPQVEVQR